MFRILILTEGNTGRELALGLSQMGFSCSMAASNGRVAEPAPDLALVKMNGHSATGQICRKLKQERGLPVITLASKQALDSLDGSRNIDDFITEPYDIKELALRIRRLLKKTGEMTVGEQIRCGDLVIDLDRYEVSVGGRLIELTFKEYELLKFLAANRGRVYTREALLNKVWGYDYFGGDRTVDVHIRRLRSKIADPKHSFIETVRSIGYRFRSN